MRRTRKTLAIWGCALLLLLAAGRRLEAEDTAPGFELSGVSADTVRYSPPDKTSNTQSDGGEPSPGDRPVTVMLFVDPTQDNSIAALSDVKAFLKRHPDLVARIRAVAIASGDDEGLLDALKSRLPPGQPVEGALDPDRAVFRAYGVIALPTTFIVRPVGTIALVLPSRSASYRKRLADGVRRALGIEVPEEAAVAEEDPETKRVTRLTTLAAELAAEGRLAQAAVQLESARKLRPADAAVLVQLGEVRLALGEAEAAKEAFGAVLATDPKHRGARRGRAKSIALGDDLDAAEKALRKELIRPPSHSSLYYFLGRVLERKGEPKKAAAAYRQAYERLQIGK